MADRLLFLNLPVRDLPSSLRFFEHLGFAFDARFTDRSGHLIAPSADGRYRVAAEGAHLALSGSGNGSAGASGAAGRTARLIVSWD